MRKLRYIRQVRALCLDRVQLISYSSGMGHPISCLSARRKTYATVLRELPTLTATCELL